MSERERPYDRYRRDRRHDLRVVLLTRWEMDAAREALGEAVKRLSNPPKSVKQMASYSAMEELKDAPRARIAEQEKRELLGMIQVAVNMTDEYFEGRENPEAVRDWTKKARALLAKHEATP